MGKNFRKCYEPHLRDYPGCFEECGCDVCEAPLFSEDEITPMEKLKEDLRQGTYHGEVK